MESQRDLNLRAVWNWCVTTAIGVTSFIVGWRLIPSLPLAIAGGVLSALSLAWGCQLLHRWRRYGDVAPLPLSGIRPMVVDEAAVVAAFRRRQGYTAGLFALFVLNMLFMALFIPAVLDRGWEPWLMMLPFIIALAIICLVPLTFRCPACGAVAPGGSDQYGMTMNPTECRRCGVRLQ